MSRSTRARWRNALTLLAVTLVAVVLGVLADSGIVATVLALALLAAAWYVSPLHHDGSISHWDAQQRHVRDGAVIVYWRPGSWTSLRLRRQLGALADQVLWVDVWEDEEGSAYVRDLNGGAEVVPTAILRHGDAVSLPTPETLRADLAAASH